MNNHLVFRIVKFASWIAICVVVILSLKCVGVWINNDYSVLQVETKAELKLRYAGRIIKEKSVVKQDGQYDVVFIKIDLCTSLLFLPSGYPVIVFNDKGVKVDATSDCGDDPGFASRWL